MKKYKILSVCGTGVATSTVVANKLKGMLAKKGITAEITEARVSEIAGKIKVFNPDAVISTTPVDESQLGGIKRFSGIPFLTNIGVEKVVDQVVEYLKSLD